MNVFLLPRQRHASRPLGMLARPFASAALATVLIACSTGAFAQLDPDAPASAMGERRYLESQGLIPPSPLEAASPSAVPAAPGPGFGPQALVTVVDDTLANNPADDTPERTTQSETAMAVLGNTICAGYNNSGPGGFSGLSRSPDLGVTWVDLGGLGANIPEVGHSGDPVIAVHEASGTFYYADIYFQGNVTPHIGVSRSTDDCNTFNAAAIASPLSGGLPDTTLSDKPWIAVDNSGGPNDGNIYACWTRFTTGASELRVSRSTDGGLTFVNEQILPAIAPFGCSIKVDSGGNVNLTWSNRAGGADDIRFNRSTDAGLTYTAPVLIDADEDGPGTGNLASCGPSNRETLNGSIRMLNQTWLAVDNSGGPFDGNLYVVWHRDGPGGGDESDVRFSRSTDSGATWSAAVDFAAGGGATDQFEPFVEVDGQGVISIAWYDRRNDPANLLIDVYKTFSSDGGVSFTPLERVTNTSFPVPPINPMFDPGIAQCYMGEYIAVAADADTFYYLWGDNRNTVISATFPGGRPDPDVFFESEMFVPDGKIIVVKQTLPDGDPQQFSFAGTVAGLVADDGMLMANVAPGQYLSTETVPAGWDLTSIVCNDGNSTGNVGTATATFNVEAGEIVTCTFTNTKRATLIVEKQTLPDGSPQSFDFTGAAVGSIQDGGQIVVGNLVPGAYDATETVPAGWDLTGIACDDGNSSGNLGTATATFNLEPGETVKCTFTNTQRATLIVEKQTIPDGAPGLFSFTGDVTGNIGDNGVLTVLLPPATYTSTEGDPTPAFDLTGLGCVEDMLQNSSVNLAARTATFRAEAGETIRCVFENTQRGTIIIEKVAEPQDGTDFAFAGDLGPFTLDDASPDDNDAFGDSLTFPFLLPNQSYAITEQGPPQGWLLQHIICDDTGNTTVDLDNATANIALDPGEEVRCVFTNGEPQVCKPFDRELTLTHNQTTVRNVENFFAVNPLSCPSGYIVAWAKDDDLGEKTPIEWNHLSGSVYIRAPGGPGLNKTYGAQGIPMQGDPQGLVASGQALIGAQGGAFPDLPFDGTAYAELPTQLATDFVATVGQRGSSLVLLTPDVNNPLGNPATQLAVDWWNEAEDAFSDSTAYRCHARRRLDDISGQFALGALGSWYGNLRVTPFLAEGILGMIEEREPNRLTLRNLFQGRPPAPAAIINEGGRQPGSAVIFPLFDISPAPDGRPHVSQFRLTNNHPSDDVDVHLFLICGQDRL